MHNRTCRNRYNLPGLLAGVALLGSMAHGQWTYPNCANATDADFAVTTVVSRALNDAPILEPLKMDFSMNADGTVDIYYIQRKGELKRYDAKTKAVTRIGLIATVTENEDGLVGMALDPDFQTKKRIFLYYAHATGFRLSRFNLDPATYVLDAGSEKILMTIPSGRGRWHTSGALKFDAYGDLWMSIGDNETTYKGPANTDDLRGGLLRIHPEEDGTYSIPKGNMWEFAANYFRGKGQAAVADKYMDSTKMRREIYVKGTRNAYTLSLDPVRRWVTYGDCGPDQESSSASTPRNLWTEEQNVVTEPSYMGWPFWTADQKPQTVFPYSSEADEKAAWTLTGMNTATPVNTFAGIGIPELMPAKPGTYVYPHSCAMTGPIFRYDGRVANAYQIPPHFNRIWFTTDFNKGRINAVKLSDEGKMVGDAVEVFKGLGTNFFTRPLDFQQGPDGALYYLNYSCGTWRISDACTGIYRIEYKGACKDANLKPEQPVAAGETWTRSMVREVTYDRQAGSLAVSGSGIHRLEVYSVEGRRIFSATGLGARRYPVGTLFAGRSRGLYRIRLVTDQGVSTLSLPYLDNSNP